MNITVEEKLMYSVMKAIYDSEIPISFKGSMVLKACLIEAGYSEDTRHTVDIDADWISLTQPSAEQMRQALQTAVDNSGLGFEVSMYRMFGEKRSAGFELKDRSSSEVLFTMDIDVDRPAPLTRIYEIEGIRFYGAAPNQIIADKLSVVSTDKVFRRIKDVVDLYYISKVFEFNKEEIVEIIERNKRVLGSFDCFLNRFEDLKHAYDKFRLAGSVDKPPFNEVYQAVKSYIKGMLPE